MASIETGVYEVHLLGPVEVLRDGERVHLGGPRQRALLALLALEVNGVVPVERLVSALFGIDAPETSVNAVQVGISRLRRELGEGMLETRSGGYVLNLVPEQLDVIRFERLLEEGRGMLRAGDAPGAVSTLSAALELFRSPPLADLTSLDFAQIEIRRLEELRLAALMERVEADLAVGRGLDLVAELEALTAEHPLQERLRGQLMLALYRAGRQSDALEVYRKTRELLRDELGLEPSRALADLEGAILRHDPSLEVREPVRAPSPAGPSAVVCPFKGLAPFGLADAAYFYGRERLVDELIAHLTGASFVGLVGSSGSGKSSLLQAGLLPALAAGGLPGSDEWRLRVIRPADAPALGLPDVPEGARVVVAVDQLEELFTLPRTESEREAFISTLVAAALDRMRRYVVVAALRADFYGRCAQYADFARLLSSNHVLLGPMKQDELARAIEQPAMQAGLRVERALVDALVDDVDGEPGALPLLSSSLLELWRERDGRLLTLASYRAAGGVDGAVARLAEKAYARLDDREQTAARAVFLRLAIEEDGALVRRRAPLDEVEISEDAARVVRVLTDARLLTATETTIEVSHEALFAEWPRLRGWLDEDSAGRRLRAHLAETARDWDARGRSHADLYRGPRLASALDWAAGHDDELNASERAFLDASRAAHEHDLARQRRENRRLRLLLAVVVALLAAAVVAGALALAARSHSQHEATVALARELGAEAVYTPRIDQAMLLAREGLNLDRSALTEGTLLATLLRSPAALATFAMPLNSRPQSVAVSPDGRTLAVSDNQATVRFFNVATRRLTRVLRRFGFTVPVAYTPDGSRFAVIGNPHGSEIDLLDAKTYRKLAVFHFDRRSRPGGVPIGGQAPLLITPDGRWLLYAYDVVGPNGSDGRAFVERWNLRTGVETTFPAGVVGANDLSVSDQGRLVAVGGFTAISFLDIRTGHRVRLVPVHDAPTILHVLASPNGRTVAFGTVAGSVGFVDVATGRVTMGVGAHAAPIDAMQFSPDDRALATAAADGTVYVWSPSTAQIAERLVGHAARVVGMAFTPDGRTLFTNSLDGAIFEWGLGSKRRFGAPFLVPDQLLPGQNVQEEPPLALAPSGREFAVRSGSSSVALLSTPRAQPVASFTIRSPFVHGLAWSPSGRVLAVTGEDGLVQLWDVSAKPRPLGTLHGLRSTNGQLETIDAVAFSREGSLLAAGDVNHTPGTVQYRFGDVAVWDLRSGKLLWRIRSRAGWVHKVAFSPSGTMLAAAWEDGVVRLYDARTGRLERALSLYGGPQDNAFSYDTFAWSPDGRMLATGEWAGILQLWDVATGRTIAGPQLVSAAPVSSIDFSPSGSLIATTGGSDGYAKLWTVPDLHQFGATFPGEPGEWGNAAFSANGSWLVTVYGPGGGIVWPATVNAWAAHACAVAGRNLTQNEWSRFVGSRTYEKTCG